MAGVDKNVLHQNKAICFGFRLATEADWDSLQGNQTLAAGNKISYDGITVDFWLLWQHGSPSRLDVTRVSPSRF